MENESKNYLSRETLDKLLDSARTLEDISTIGVKLNEAIDNNYHGVDICDYQIKTAMKRKEIVNKLGRS